MVKRDLQSFCGTPEAAPWITIDLLTTGKEMWLENLLPASIS